MSSTEKTHENRPGSGNDNQVASGVRAIRTITDAAQQISQQQWALGDLCTDIAGPARSGQQSSIALVPEIQSFADQIGADYDALMEYRRVSTAWPRNERNTTVTWVLHRELATYDDRQNMLKNFLASTGQRPTFRSLQQFLGNPRSIPDSGAPDTVTGTMPD